MPERFMFQVDRAEKTPAASAFFCCGQIAKPLHFELTSSRQHQRVQLQTRSISVIFIEIE